jgi:hypothetical protein
METATKLRMTIAGALFAGTMALGAGQASAMPAIDHGLAATQGVQAEQVRWVCNPWGRCWWRPGPRFYGGYGFYRPRPYWGGYGWRHRGWW